MHKIEDLKKYFIDNSPDGCDKEKLSFLIDEVWQCHPTKKDKDQFISRLIDFKKNGNKIKWYSLHAEIHSLYLISKNLPRGDSVVFSPKDNNDLLLFTSSGRESIEVKSILFNSFEENYNYILNKIENIPSGKVVYLTINPQKTKDVIEEIDKIKKIESEGYEGNNISIKVIKEIQDKNKTALISNPIVGWVPMEDLGSLIVDKIWDKKDQISKADTVIFYFYNSTYDVEDVCESLKKASDRVPILEDKKVKVFVKWNGGGLIDLRYNGYQWII